MQERYIVRFQLLDLGSFLETRKEQQVQLILTDASGQASIKLLTLVDTHVVNRIFKTNRHLENTDIPMSLVKVGNLLSEISPVRNLESLQLEVKTLFGLKPCVKDMTYIVLWLLRYLMIGTELQMKIVHFRLNVNARNIRNVDDLQKILI